MEIQFAIRVGTATMITVSYAERKKIKKMQKRLKKKIKKQKNKIQPYTFIFQ